YSAQHTRVKEAPLYGWGAFVFDCIGVGVFFWITRDINLFEQGSLQDHPAKMFPAMTFVPGTSIGSRLAMDLEDGWPLVAVGVLASIVGWAASLTDSSSAVAWGMMFLLLALLAIYLIINFVEDGDPKHQVSWLVYWYPFKEKTEAAAPAGESTVQ